MKKNTLFLSFLILGSLIANTAKAICPICVVAVGAGFGLSRWLGVDDIISSLWIGAFLAALSMWTLIWLRLKNWDFKYSKVIVPTAYYLLVLAPLYYVDIIGHPLNTIFGIDKIIFGSALGTIVFLLSLQLHDFSKRKNQGKQLFTYQKVVLPFVVLLIVSLLTFFLLK